MNNIKLNKIAQYIKNADAIVIGAGAGFLYQLDYYIVEKDLLIILRNI